MNYVQTFNCCNCNIEFGVTQIIFGTPHCPKCNYIEAVDETNHNIEILKVKIKKYEKVLGDIEETLKNLVSDFKVKDFDNLNLLEVGTNNGWNGALLVIRETKEQGLKVHLHSSNIHKYTNTQI